MVLDLSKYYTNGKPGYEPPKAYTYESKAPKYVWVEPKIDGVRALVFCTPNGVIITSRRQNKDGVHRQWQDNLPHLRNSPALIRRCEEGKFTILDGEIVMTSLSSTMSVIGALPTQSVMYQKAHGWAKLILFDTPVCNGDDISGYSLVDRKGHLAEWASVDYVNIIPFDGYELLHVEAAFAKHLAEGYEGTILKDPNAGYWKKRAWLKYKKSLTIDALVTGYVPGKGKYAGLIGALTMCVYNQSGELQEICNVAPGDDFDRRRWTHHFKHGGMEDHRILEIECQQWGAQKRLRHPRILKARPDLSEPNRVNFSATPPEVMRW